MFNRPAVSLSLSGAILTLQNLELDEYTVYTNVRLSLVWSCLVLHIVNRLIHGNNSDNNNIHLSHIFISATVKFYAFIYKKASASGEFIHQTR